MRSTPAVSVRPALFVLAALAALASCMKKDPDFCCSTQESCSRNGGPGVLTPCTDPERPFCDDDGQYGIGRTCIADPVSNPCETPAECTNPDRPVCLERHCVQCGASPDCDAASPVCDQGTHLCGSCEGNDDCALRAGTPRCLVSTGACVACLDGGDCAAAAAPVCDPGTHECRACRADTECASAVCDRDAGSCVAEASIIYLSPSGAAAGTCTRASPCSTFALGIAQVNATRNVIKAAPGMYTGQVVLDGVTVSIFADGATAQPSALNQSVVVVTNGADATIKGLTVTGAGGATNPVGVQCSPGAGGTPTLRLERSTVIANAGGGVSISNCEFALVNNVVAGNGGPLLSSVGVTIAQISAATGPLHDFSFNTVTSNVAVANTTTGVECVQIATPLAFANNIVYANQVAGTGTQVGGDADCSWSYSDIGPQSAAGMGNLNMDPLFVDVAGRNFHLMGTSPAKNVADPTANLPVDIDLESRPQGGRSDMGADEVLE